MPQYHTTSDPWNNFYYSHSQPHNHPNTGFIGGINLPCFFSPPNHLSAKSIHLDHCLLRVFESLLPPLPSHHLSLFPRFLPAALLQSFFHNSSISPACPPSSAPSVLPPLSALNIHTTLRTLHVMCFLCVYKFRAEVRTYLLMTGEGEGWRGGTDAGRTWFAAAR